MADSGDGDYCCGDDDMVARDYNNGGHGEDDVVGFHGDGYDAKKPKMLVMIMVMLVEVV